MARVILNPIIESIRGKMGHMVLETIKGEIVVHFQDFNGPASMGRFHAKINSGSRARRKKRDEGRHRGTNDAAGRTPTAS